MKGIYLGAYKAQHSSIYDITYQDINGLRDLDGDMVNIDLFEFDYIICTPPCNYWSRANWRRDTSEYSIKTRLLLPLMVYKLSIIGKPFIVENVRNDKQFRLLGLFNIPGCYVYHVGRHTYWSNQVLYLDDIVQKPITCVVDGKKKYMSSQNLPGYLRQGTSEVAVVVERFLKTIYERRY